MERYALWPECFKRPKQKADCIGKEVHSLLESVIRVHLPILALGKALRGNSQVRLSLPLTVYHSGGLSGPLRQLWPRGFKKSMTLELHLHGVTRIHQALTGSMGKMGIWAQATACVFRGQ